MKAHTVEKKEYTVGGHTYSIVKVSYATLYSFKYTKHQALLKKKKNYGKCGRQAISWEALNPIVLHIELRMTSLIGHLQIG